MTDVDALERRIEKASVAELEKIRETILNELDQIARLSMNSGVGRIGFRSEPHDQSQEQEWIQIDFGELVPVDKIVLVPALWRDAELGFVADGFPAAFSITAGTGQADEGLEIASFDSSHDILPRTAPFIINLEPVQTSWIRITATQLNPRNIDGRFALQLAEILIFSGHRNAALGQKVTTSSVVHSLAGAWREDFAVDGIMPYLMDAAEGKGSVAYVNAYEEGSEVPHFTLDLLEPFTLDHLILHVVEQTDTVPQAFPGDFGVPFAFILEGSRSADFSDPVLLLQYEREGALDVGPIMSFNLEPFTCQYVRLTALKPYRLDGFDYDGKRISDNRLGFAEVELLSDGRNVARGKGFDPGHDTPDDFRRVEALTDGNNLYGRILDIREWLDQLAKRHDLLVELPLVNMELEKHYARQKLLLQFAILLLVGSALLILSLILLARNRQQRAIFRTRERITADLHDALGGNVSAMVLLSEMAGRQRRDEGKLNHYLERIENLATRTRNSLKYVSNMLNQPGLYENLFAEMERISRGLTEGLEHSMNLSGEQYVTSIHQSDRVDVFLFFKECLVNIIRHSQASTISTQLEVTDQHLKLRVCDNGIGLNIDNNGSVPPSLRRRARIMGGRVNASAPESGGCCIELHLPWKRPRTLRFLKWVILSKR